MGYSRPFHAISLLITFHGASAALACGWGQWPQIEFLDLSHSGNIKIASFEARYYDGSLPDPYLPKKNPDKKWRSRCSDNLKAHQSSLRSLGVFTEVVGSCDGESELETSGIPRYGKKVYLRWSTPELMLVRSASVAWQYEASVQEESCPALSLRSSGVRSRLKTCRQAVGHFQEFASLFGFTALAKPDLECGATLSKFPEMGPDIYISAAPLALKQAQLPERQAPEFPSSHTICEIDDDFTGCQQKSQLIFTDDSRFVTTEYWLQKLDGSCSKVTKPLISPSYVSDWEVPIETCRFTDYTVGGYVYHDFDCDQVSLHFTPHGERGQGYISEKHLPTGTNRIISFRNCRRID